MGRFRDPDAEPAIPAVPYSQDYAPPIISDPDDSHVSTPSAISVPSALVPKVKMNTPKEFRVGQDAEVWLETVDRYFEFTYPGASDKDLVTVFLTFLQNNDRHFFQVVAKSPTVTFADVRITFLRQFGNPHKQSVAKRHLMTLEQGSKPFAEYLRTFTSLASLAAVSLEDILVKDRLITNMDPSLGQQFFLRHLTEEERNSLSWSNTTKILLDLNYVVYSKQSETLYYKGQKEQSGGPVRKEKDFRGRENKPYDRSNQNQLIYMVCVV